jgi:hypothetical protein
MTLHFPNHSRSYDAVHARVCFWGHAAATEVTFFLEEEALFRIAPGTPATEAGILQAFDAHRDRILAIATKAFSREKASVYVLMAKDFRSWHRS